MAFYLSPLVDVREYDASTTIPAVATSIGVIVLRDTYKGPELKTQFITSTNQLIDVFGKPTSDPTCFRDMLAATGYLKYGSMLYATRALPASATFAGVYVPSGSITSGAELTYTLATLSAAILTDDVDDYATVTNSSNFLQIISKSRGACGNNIRIALASKSVYETYSSIVASGGISASTYQPWSTSAAIGGVDSALEDEKSFLILVQVAEQGMETTEPSGGPTTGVSNWYTQEVFNVSVDENAYDDTGVRRFVETMVNGSSNYIRISLGSAYRNLSSITTNTTDWVYLTGGISGDAAADKDDAILAALNLFRNPEDIDANIFIDSDKSLTVKNEMIDICAARKDAMAILDVPIEYVVGNRGSETEDLRQYVSTTLNANTSYAAIYGNWIEVYDRWNGKYRWIPASGHVAGLFANNDYVAEPWFAPAGPNRAVITSIRRLAWNPSLGDRNILYKYGINPIVSLTGMGKMIYGQKTLLSKESAFNRINVRRLFMVLEKAISTAARYFLFEPNDDISRLLLINMIDPFLRDVKARRGVYDYLVVCNETNNTPERIDRGELWCDIFIKPTRAAEFIVLNFVATKTGANFSEISGITG